MGTVAASRCGGHTVGTEIKDTPTWRPGSSTHRMMVEARRLGLSDGRHVARDGPQSR